MNQGDASSEAASAFGLVLRAVLGPSLAKVWLTMSGNAMVASQLTFTGDALRRILPQLMASSVHSKCVERNGGEH